MRPLDIPVLLKIIAKGNYAGTVSELAYQLSLSQSEISESLNRSLIAGLLDGSKKKVFKLSFLDFLTKGFKYVFPAIPGPITKGIPTAHSAKPLSNLMSDNSVYVIPDSSGDTYGQSINPLYPNITRAAKSDARFYELIALADSIRVGKAREFELASKELRKKIMNGDEYA